MTKYLCTALPLWNHIYMFTFVLDCFSVSYGHDAKTMSDVGWSEGLAGKGWGISLEGVMDVLKRCEGWAGKVWGIHWEGVRDGMGMYEG